MTADEARELTAKARSVDDRQVAALLTQWEQAIRDAAGKGLGLVHEDELPRLRMPITTQARQFAREELRRRGFVVQKVATGPNDSTYVAWWQATQ